MDTRSKGIRYSIITKAVVVFILWASFAGLFSSAFYVVHYSDELNTKDYHMTFGFIYEFIQHTQNAYEFAVRQNSGDNIKNVKNFEYLVLDTNTGSVISNIRDSESPSLQAKIERLKKQPFYFYISKDRLETSIKDNSGFFGNLELMFRNSSLEMYAADVEPFKRGGAFYDTWYVYTKVHEFIPFFITLSSLSLLFGIASFIYLVIVAGRKEKDGKIRLCFVDRIYTDVQSLLVLLAALASINMVQHYGRPSDNIVILGLCFFLLLSVDIFIGLTYILSMARHIKNRTLMRHMLIYVVGSALIIFARKCMGAKTFRISVIIFLLAYGFLNSFLFAILVTHGSFIIFLLWAALNIAGVYYISKSLISLSDIMKWIRGISTGNLVDSPDIKKLSPAFAGFAEDVSNIQSGLRNAVTEAVKGERLKTELITNVSHDLKTPLTSIINYVDLLKKEETESENVRQYTAILEEKSNRLKQLIDDLLEASKAASGNLAINFESIDLYSLTLQASAEFNEKAAAAGLDLRIRPIEKAPIIHADGKLMWRIMENLLSNVLKYSQKDSRVYMEVETSGLYGMITIKNISSLPLDIPADQLMERFVRGDRSRSEEGSGLGLAIAKSLAEVQGGRLEIVIDGDLFKVSISIPLENQS